MGHLVTVAACSLNQFALDFEGNRDRIIQSIKIAKERGAKLRVGPELEITGYDCLDHFLENDTYLHSWDMLYQILSNKDTHGILLDIGLPIIHRTLRLNCRAICLDGRILLIRPKIWLANDGIYREMRHFTPWLQPHKVQQFALPRMIAELQGASHVPIGDACIALQDTVVGCETCEELFTPNAPHTNQGLNGVEIITNSSGSHHYLRRLKERLSLIVETTRKDGGCYIYANLKGCGGERVYYDNSSMIVLNGEVLAQDSQFSLEDVSVITATIDLEEIRAYRSSVSRGLQAVGAPEYERIQTPFSLSPPSAHLNLRLTPTLPREISEHHAMEEIALGPACWLFDYLRRSRLGGFILPLSGGIDSCSTAVIVFSMCRIVIKAIEQGNEQVTQDIERIVGSTPKTAKELCNNILHTVYMGMSKNSSKETRNRAKDLAEAIGSYHIDLDIDESYQAQVNILKKATGFSPRFASEGGSNPENLALQNIQARLRMVTAYELGALLPTIRQLPGARSLLVLGSSNVDEALRGYYTRYDNSSADINPIGSISKTDLRSFIAWAQEAFNLPVLESFLSAVPTAELLPLNAQQAQTDEAEMGLTYPELSTFGILRKVKKMAPFSMFERLAHQWKTERGMSAREVAAKVKRFWHFYAVNRYKMTTLTPGYHAESYNPDDNRFDLRPFLLPPQYESWAFKRIDRLVEEIEKDEKPAESSSK